jgi:hypothetical protein
MIELLLQAERALSVGLLDRAETLYQQVATADPRNSIAVVGLARVRLERGDEPGALELAGQALLIDPENTAAQRMVQRLEEVQRYRDEPVPLSYDVAPSIPEPAPSEPEPVAELVPAFEPEPAPLPESDPLLVPAPSEPAPLPEPAPSPEPAPPRRRRSWLDRLFRRR